MKNKHYRWKDLGVGWCLKEVSYAHYAQYYAFIWSKEKQQTLWSSDARSWFFVADSDTDFFWANWPIPIPIPIFFPLSNQQEIMKDSNTNKVVI